ncbi:hypothetical protein [Undibacterium sp. Di24W]|uniref:hypothetical protein n=1 Tax=Undibacterium sp. Di24W TaxID=3413033 RepID=UPI003BF29CAB
MKPSATQAQSNNTCQHLSIANSKIGEIMICPECGVVHLSLQSISMRFDLEAFGELAKMVRQAKATIEQAQRFSSDKSNQVDDLRAPSNALHEALMQDNIYSRTSDKVH